MHINFDDAERPVLIERLGLSDDVTDDDIATAMSNVLLTTPASEEVEAHEEETPPAPAGTGEEEHEEETPPEGSEEDTVVVDIAAWRSLNERAGLATRLQEEDRIGRRTTLIEGAIRDGKFPPSRREHYSARFDSDPEDTERLIGRMVKGSVPLEARGVDAPEEEADDQTAYPKEWVPDVAANHKRSDDRQADRSARRSRVTTED